MNRKNVGAPAPRGRGLLAGAALCIALAAGAAAQERQTGPPAATAPPAAEGPVSLQEAIGIAQENHARVAVAEEAVIAARERVRQARTGTLPQLTGEVAYRGRGSSNLADIFGRKPAQTVPGFGGAPPQRVIVDTETAAFDQGIQPRFIVNYNLYDAGLTRTSVRQARASVDGSQASLGAVRRNLAFEVTSNYLFQLRAERLLELRLAQEDLAAQQLRRVEARISLGSAAAADRALTLSELRNRQVDRILAQNDARVAANTLRNSMGLPVGPPLRLVEPRENVDPLPDVETLRDMARRQRPEVIQAEAQERVSRAGVKIARIQRRPRLDTTFAFNARPNDPLTRSDWAVGAALSMPLWDAGLTHAREQEARSGVESSVAQLEQVRKDVTSEVEEAYLNLANARERLEASRLAVEAAQVNLQQTTARYEQGIGGTSVVELVQAQVQFANANNSAIQALYDVHLAQAQLNRAIGR